MFAAFTLATLMMAAADPTAAKDVDTRAAHELARILDEARRDFEVRHAELGLLGSAPMPGRELARAAGSESARLEATSPAPVVRGVRSAH